MKTKRRTEISVEIRRILLIRRSGGAQMGWCSECAADTRVVTPEEAAILSRVSSRTIYRWIETDRIHFSETASGLLLICLTSLLETTREGWTP